jgi:hypothetical protein
MPNGAGSSQPSGRAFGRLRACTAAHAQYGGFAAGMLLFGFVFANAVPFFGDMLGCVRRVGGTCLSFHLSWLRFTWLVDSAWCLIVAWHQ